MTKLFRDAKVEPVAPGFTMFTRKLLSGKTQSKTMGRLIWRRYSTIEPTGLIVNTFYDRAGVGLAHLIPSVDVLPHS